jgi:hypothetical protein
MAQKSASSGREQALLVLLPTSRRSSLGFEGERAEAVKNAATIRRNIAARRARFAEHREIDRAIHLDSLAILEEVLGHFYWKARVLEGLGEEGDYDVLDRAWADVGRWAEKVANFRHPKVQAVRLAGDPNAPVLPENMTLDELRDSIMADLERLRETGVLDLPQLPHRVVDKS